MTPSLLLSGRYRVATRIGQGGMSEVWQATDEVLDRPVAIKVLAAASPDASSGADPIGVIRGEAQAAARLSHPHVASVYDFGEDVDESGNRIAYIVMELLSGQSLGQRLTQGPIGPGPALRIMAEVASALAAAHAIGVVHRDVKPGNIMLTPFGAKVFDFGIAASAGDTDHGDARGRILGTPSYVAPERLAGARVTPAADMYAFGVLLTRLFEEPEEAPPEIDRLRRRCLAADPRSRPSSAEAHAMVSVLADRPPGARIHSGPTIPLPVPAAAGLPSTDYLPAPPDGVPAGARRPLRRWSLVAAALLLVAAGLSSLAVAVEHSTRTSTAVSLPSPPGPGSTKGQSGAPVSPDPMVAPASPDSVDSTDADDDSAQSRFAAAVTSSCEAEARRRNELLTRLARWHAFGHRSTLTASVVCRNGIPTLEVSR